MASYLVIIADREALAWVLTTQRMAFSARREALVADLASGDELFLYSTRGAFHNPTRDRGRVLGLARAATAVNPLAKPLLIAGRTFELGCRLELRSLAPLGAGVDLSPLVPRMKVFPKKPWWSAWMRRPLLKLPPDDAMLLRKELKSLARPPASVVGQYVAAARPAG